MIKNGRLSQQQFTGKGALKAKIIYRKGGREKPVCINSTNADNNFITNIIFHRTLKENI